MKEGKGSQSQDENEQHDGQLEVGVQGNGKHLGSCQQKGDGQHNTVPEPQLWPARRANQHSLAVSKTGHH